MNTDRERPDSFDRPGFVSESRPELEELRSVAHRSKQTFFFARYRHHKHNLGLLEPTPLADQVMAAVELKALRPTNVFRDGRHVRKPESGPGALALYDLRKSWSADLRDPFDNVSVYLPLSSFHDFAAERDNNFLELRYDVQQPVYDQVMLGLAQAILPALERPREISPLYLESLFFAARDHIAMTYGVFGAKTRRSEWGLTARQLRHVLEYIEANLSEDVSLAEIARACASSISSLSRGFKTALGISPHQWILNRRIALAQRLIYEGAMALSEVAVCGGFVDQSHLTRAFVSKVGNTPAAWRRNARM